MAALTPPLTAYQQKLATLEEKLRRLKSGELNAEYLEGEKDQQIRQGETIARVEKFIREVKEAIAQDEKTAAAKTKKTA